MSKATADQAEAPPVTRCDKPDCAAEDDHPKFHQYVGRITIKLPEGFVTEVPNPDGIYHEHDTDQDGYVAYHFDCAAELGHQSAAEQIAGQEDLRGDDRRAALISNAADKAASA